MRLTTRSLIFCAVALAAPAVWAQALPQPAPEHKRLKDLEGDWECTVKMPGGEESKATCSSKMLIGDLWLESDFEADFGGMKFSGRGLDSYDPGKKKYVGVWVDSMTTTPMLSEGTMDKDGKVLTMIGDGVGMDGKPMKYKMVTVYKSKDEYEFSMTGSGADGQELPMLTITYHRKKKSE